MLEKLEDKNSSLLRENISTSNTKDNNLFTDLTWEPSINSECIVGTVLVTAENIKMGWLVYNRTKHSTTQ